MQSVTVPPMYPKRTNLGDVNYELTGNGYSSAVNSDDPSALMDVSVNADFKSEYVLFKNALIDRYWWQEIGCDEEEIFIEKFKSRWDVYAPLYANNIRVLTNNFIYDRIKSSNKSNTRGTGYIMGQHTASESANKTDSQRDITAGATRTDTDTQNTSASDSQKSTVTDTGTQKDAGTQKDFGANVQETTNARDSDNTRNSAYEGSQSGTLNDTKSSTENKTSGDTYTEMGEKNNETQQDTRRDNFGTDTEAITETTTYYDIEKIREIPQALVLLEDFIHRFKSLFMLVYTEM